MGSLFSKENKILVKDSYNEFSFELFKVFISRHEKDYKNLSFSPFSVFNALSMVLIGAEDNTEEELENVLNLKNFNKNTKMYEELQTLRESIIKSNHDSISSVTYLYIDKTVNLRPEYNFLLQKHFEIKPKHVDFSDVEKTVEIINRDASSGTDEVIDNVIRDKDITDNKDVKMILSNAFFFRAFWATSFQVTEPQVFRYGKGCETTDIQMMKSLSNRKYFFDTKLRSEIISFKYVASDLQMIIILPKDPMTDPIQLIKELDRNEFLRITEQLKREKSVLVEVFIPRFGLDAQHISLQKTLKKMGAQQVFKPYLAQLKNMCRESIHLTKIVHKGFIIVDERGATSELVRRKEVDYKTFKANHPFVFIIYDRVSAVVIFMGLFSDPNEMLEIVSENQMTAEEIHHLLHSHV